MSDIDDYQECINALLECEDLGKKCKGCKDFKSGDCLHFIRSCIGLLMTLAKKSREKEEAEAIYS